MDKRGEGDTLGGLPNEIPSLLCLVLVWQIGILAACGTLMDVDPTWWNNFSFFLRFPPFWLPSAINITVYVKPSEFNL